MIDIPVTIEKTPPNPTNVDITVSQSAIDKITELMEDDQIDNQFLRITLQGGGCAGFQYGFMFDDEILDTDVVVEAGDIKVVLDALSLPMLNGSIVDYQSSLTGSQFLISNPNATTTCGCGSSFSC